MQFSIIKKIYLFFGRPWQLHALCLATPRGVPTPTLGTTVPDHSAEDQLSQINCSHLQIQIKILSSLHMPTIYSTTLTTVNSYS